MRLKEDELTKIVEKFILDQQIHCEEDIYEYDHVIENACKFIEELCSVVGYLPEEGDGA